MEKVVEQTILSLFFSVIFAIENREFSKMFFSTLFSNLLEYINFGRNILNNNLPNLSLRNMNRATNLSFRALNYSNLFL